MRRIPLLILLLFGLLAGDRLFADVVILNDGRQVSGTVESGNTQELRIKVADQSQAIDIHEVRSIQFGVSQPAQTTATPSSKAADATPAPAQPNSLFLKDGTHVAGRWWSIDATDMHFLVNDQLQHYPRPGVLGVTFGNATLAPPPVVSPPAAGSAQPPASPAQPARAPTLGRSTASSPPPTAQAPTAQPPTAQPPTAQPPTLTRPSGGPASSRGVSQPDEIGMVYFWNGKVLIPLERNQAVERKKGSTAYFEMRGPKSSVRVSETSHLVFILRLPPGVDAAGYSLFQLVTAEGNRRTRSDPDRRGGLMTWQVDIEKNNESSLITYNLTVRDLPTGEWSFSPSNSNDAYCFGVDSEPGK